MAENQESPTQEIVITGDPFAADSWSDTPPEVVEEKKEDVIVEEKKDEVKDEKNPAESVKDEQPAKPPVVEAEPFWKELGFETPEAAKAHFEETKTPKKAELEFANEESKKLFEYMKEGKTDEVFQLLAQQRRLSAVADMKPADAIKLNLEMKNPHYKADDVQDIFEDTYQIPDKPEQGLDEEDDEYADRLSKWETKVEKINRRIERDAVEAKANLASMAKELVLPDINSTQKSNAEQIEAQRKESERVDNARRAFLESLESDHSKFDGFKTTAKSEDAELPVAFVVTDQEKAALKESLKNFDIDTFVANNWLTKEGKPNVQRMMEDIYLLQNRDKVFAKFANDSAQQSLETYLKNKGQINVTGEAPKKGSPKVDSEAIANHFFSN